MILRGAGTEAFSSGYDISRLAGSVEDLDADAFIGEAVSALRACPAPVIAQIHGHCHGAAVEIALSCDLRIASDDLRMSVPAVSLGVVYRYQFLARLVQICGLARASDLLLAMPELDAERAHQWGLVTEILPRWDVSDVYDSLTGRRFGAAIEQLEADTARLAAAFDHHDIRRQPARPATAPPDRGGSTPPPRRAGTKGSKGPETVGTPATSRSTSRK